MSEGDYSSIAKLSQRKSLFDLIKNADMGHRRSDICINILDMSMCMTALEHETADPRHT